MSHELRSQELLGGIHLPERRVYRELPDQEVTEDGPHPHRSQEGRNMYYPFTI